MQRVPVLDIWNVTCLKDAERSSCKEVGVTLKRISVTQQNADHPFSWNMEESSYLKFYISRLYMKN